MIIKYEGYWYCDFHNEDFTSEGICPGCYGEMQHGDTLASDTAHDKHALEGPPNA